MFRQLAPMGTGGFNVALDINILKDAVVDHRLPIQNMLMAHTDGRMTPGQVAMTPYDTNSPARSESNFKGESVAFSPLTVNGGDDPTNFSFLPHGQSPLGAGGMLPVGPGYSPSPPNAYSPTSPYYVPQSLYVGATSPFGTSLTRRHHFMIGARGPHPLFILLEACHLHCPMSHSLCMQVPLHRLERHRLERHQFDTTILRLELGATPPSYSTGGIVEVACAPGVNCRRSAHKTATHISVDLVVVLFRVDVTCHMSHVTVTHHNVCCI